MSFDLAFFVDFVLTPSAALITGVGLTVMSAVVAQTVGTAIGTIAALGKLSTNAPGRLLSSFYVWFFRGVPTLVQIFLVYFGTASLFNVDLFPTSIPLGSLRLSGAVVAGVVALSINEGAYMAEIVRAGIMSVDRSQREAALAVGMTERETMRRVILPQAMRIIVPPLGNQFNNMLKLTSLLSVIGVRELFRVAQGVNAATFRTFEAFFGAALYYLVLVSLWNYLQQRIEWRLAIPPHTGRPPRNGDRLHDELAGQATRERTE